MDIALEDIKIGDIVWANRFKTKREAALVAENHRVGPFIIIKKTDRRTYSLMCTSNPKNNKFRFKRNIGKISTNTEKDTYRTVYQHWCALPSRAI